MTEFRTRIGRVIRKGGADVKIIDGKFEWHGEATATVEAFRENAEKVADFFPDMAGYAIIAWDARGRTSLGYRNTKSSPIPAFMVPSFAAEALREDIITNSAVDWINSQRSPR